MNSERRGLVVVIAVLLVSAVLGGIYGPNVRATTASADDYQTAVRDFTRVLNVVQNNYADTVDVDKAVYQGAIPGSAGVQRGNPAGRRDRQSRREVHGRTDHQRSSGHVEGAERHGRQDYGFARRLRRTARFHGDARRDSAAFGGYHVHAEAGRWVYPAVGV